MSRIAVVLFNLGGPDSPEAVKPFLFNLFSDPAIIGLPGLFRTALARLISSRREESAKANYAIMGGASPLLPETKKQAAALDAVLAERLAGHEVRSFIAMRYWRPLVEETAREVAAFAPEEIVLLPLYPQFSTTTTASSLKAWAAAYKGPGRVRTVCCYPDDGGFVGAYARLIEEAWSAAGKPEPVRLLFSAHGLPEKVVKGGDPYQAQVEATAAAIAARLPRIKHWQVCYQSRVGPLKWIGPATDQAIVQGAEEGLALIVAPIAFVSEHIETLVELDHEYAKLAEEAGCPAYIRAPAVGVAEGFIASLAELAVKALERPSGIAPGSAFVCQGHGRCPRTREAA
ncbi:MAG TPA: ferrochelatase [Caulobacteraceae bacterium]